LRKLARLKYTLDKVGWIGLRMKLEKRSGFSLAPAKPYEFTQRKDYWMARKRAGLWYYSVFVENGRVVDDDKVS